MSSLLQSYNRQAPGTRNISSRPLTLDGTLGGDRAMNVDGSVTPVEFFTAPSPTETFIVTSLTILVSDKSAPLITDYGSVPGPLAVGVTFWAQINGAKFDLSFPPIKQNTDFMRISRDFAIFEFGSSVRVLQYVEDFDRIRAAIQLNGAEGDQIGIRISDDLTNLDDHQCQMKGFRQPVDITTPPSSRRPTLP